MTFFRKLLGSVSILTLVLFVSLPTLAAHRRARRDPEPIPSPAESVQVNVPSAESTGAGAWLGLTLGLGAAAIYLWRKNALLREIIEEIQAKYRQKIQSKEQRISDQLDEIESLKKKGYSLQTSYEGRSQELFASIRRLDEIKSRLESVLTIYPDAEKKAKEAARKKAEEEATIAQAQERKTQSQQMMNNLLNEMKRG